MHADRPSPCNKVSKSLPLKHDLVRFGVGMYRPAPKFTSRFGNSIRPERTIFQSDLADSLVPRFRHF